ncbi:MAG: c-type cytochrome biogenesis protein CcmI [Rhodospirillales bacterium]
MTGLWIAAVAMTAVALAAVVVPLLRGRERAAAVRRDYDLTVYKDQLAEIERDVERGLFDAAEAEAARIEIQRRILAAAGPEADDRAAPAPPGRTVAAILGVALPAAAFGVYLALGSPDAPNFPIAERTTTPAARTADHEGGLDRAEVMKLAARLRERLESEGGDAQGWVLLARTYLSANEFPGAVAAYRRALKLSGNRMDIATDYAEALVMAEGGRVPDEAQALFGNIIEAEPLNPRARYYAGLGLAQRDDLRGALQAWTDLKALAPPGAQWLETVDQQIARAAQDLGVAPWSVKPTAEAMELAQQVPRPAPEPPAQAAAPGATPRPGAPGPTAEDMAAAAEISAADRQRMIRGMVQRLADRLKDEPDDLEGWRRLARSYEVLGETGKAASARARAEALAAGSAPPRAVPPRAVPPSAAPPPAAAPPGPSAADVDAASRMSAAGRDEMIRGMVQRLADRLKDEPDDEAGWRRLARAYQVLGEAEKAKEALNRADALAAGKGR